MTSDRSAPFQSSKHIVSPTNKTTNWQQGIPACFYKWIGHFSLFSLVNQFVHTVSFHRRFYKSSPGRLHSNRLTPKRINRVLLFISISWVTLLIGCSNSDVTTLGDWRTLAQFEGVGRSAAVSFVIGEVAYVGTGVNDKNDLLKDFWAFDQTRNAWTQVADFGGVARNSGVGFAIASKGYVGTGSDASYRLLKDFWEYNPGDNTWVQIATFDGAVRRNAVSFSVNNKGYVGTGYDGTNYLKDFWVYDPTSGSWEKMVSYGGAKRQGAISFVINNIAYVGTGSSNVAQSDWWSYDPAQDLWIQKDDFDVDDEEYVARSYGVGFAIGSRGYVTIGDGSSTVWEYNPNEDSWSDLGVFEGGSRQRAVGFAINGKGYISTGISGSTYFDDLWEFDPTIEQDTDDN